MGAKALFDLGSSAAAEAEKLQNLSAMTGLSTQELQALAQISKEAGLEGLDLGRVLGTLNAQLAKGEKGDFAEALKKFNIAANDLVTGAPKSAVALLDELRAKFLAIEDPVLRARYAQEALGGRLKELIPLILNSSESLGTQIEKLKGTGVVWDDITQNKLKQFDEALDLTGRMWAGFVTSIKAGIGSMLGDFTDLVRGVNRGLDEMKLEDKVKMSMATQKNMLVEFGKEYERFGKVIAESLFGKTKEQIEAEEKAQKAAAKAIKEHAAAMKEAMERDANYWLKMGSEATQWTKILEACEKVWGHWHDTAKEALGDIGEKAKKMSETMANLAPRGIDWDKELGKPATAITKEMQKVQVEMARYSERIRQGWADLTSSIVSGFSEGLADMSVSGKRFTEEMLSIFRQWGKNMLSAIFDAVLNPVKQLLSGIGASLGGILTGAGTAGGVGGIAAYGAMGPTAGGASAGGAAGLGAISASAGIAASLALAGFVASQILVGVAQGATTAGSMIKEASKLYGTAPLFSGGMTEYMTGMFPASLGLSEAQAWGIRKDLLSSPKYLSQMAGFINPESLKNITTSFGTFDFSKAFETGKATGNWAELNKQFKEAFKNSEALVSALPDWETVLMAPQIEETAQALSRFSSISVRASTLAADLAQKIQSEISSISGFIDSLQSLHPELAKNNGQLQGAIAWFSKTGEVTETLRNRIKDCGGDIGKFEEYAHLNKLKDDFADLRLEFQQSYIVTDKLRELYKQFGLDISALDAASAIPGLSAFQNSLSGLKATLLDIVGPAKDTLEYFLKFGTMSPALMDKIISAGGRPEDFTAFWTAQQTNTKMAQWLEQLKGGTLTREFYTWLRQHGLTLPGMSADTTTAFRNIPGMTPGWTEEQWKTFYQQVTEAAQKDYVDTAAKLLESINAMDANLGNQIKTLQDAATDSLDALGVAIDDSITVAAQDLVIELGKINRSIQAIGSGAARGSGMGESNIAGGGGRTGPETTVIINNNVVDAHQLEKLTEQKIAPMLAAVFQNNGPVRILTRKSLQVH
jgi:hypothetical protein